jgi:hypothetical protein
MTGIPRNEHNIIADVLVCELERRRGPLQGRLKIPFLALLVYAAIEAITTGTRIKHLENTARIGAGQPLSDFTQILHLAEKCSVRPSTSENLEMKAST